MWKGLVYIFKKNICKYKSTQSKDAQYTITDICFGVYSL